MTDKNTYQPYVYPSAPIMDERDTSTTPLYPKVYTTEAPPSSYVTFNPYPHHSQPSIIYLKPNKCHHHHRKDDCYEDCCCTII